MKELDSDTRATIATSVATVSLVVTVFSIATIGSNQAVAVPLGLIAGVGFFIVWRLFRNPPVSDADYPTETDERTERLVQAGQTAMHRAATEEIQGLKPEQQATAERVPTLEVSEELLSAFLTRDCVLFAGHRYLRTSWGTALD